MVYVYLPSFVSIGLFRRPLAVKTIFSCFWTMHFVVSPIRSSLKNLNMGAQLQAFPIQSIKIASVLQRLHDEIGRTNSDVQKRDEQTDRQTDKNSTFWPPQRLVKSEYHQPWHGDREPRARSCAVKTSGDLTHRFAARRR